MPDPGRPKPRRTTPPTTAEHDPDHESPLGRGAQPGPVDDVASTTRKPGALHGAGVPGEKGGPSGEVDRENEDARTKERREE